MNNITSASFFSLQVRVHANGVSSKTRRLFSGIFSRCLLSVASRSLLHGMDSSKGNFSSSRTLWDFPIHCFLFYLVRFHGEHKSILILSWASKLIPTIHHYDSPLSPISSMPSVIKPPICQLFAVVQQNTFATSSHFPFAYFRLINLRIILLFHQF